ncbi:hypothetical protein CQW23_02344 [Capsicum baccatum]|uniref:Uncharacterized protein n=1 Tax=Capsicum baccatum TaxID=33114 RepID=A0A2G2XRJ8_CAPBA|nr:hypothetical protein CQW23_02344 [Capsicum baccatum]
MILAKIFRALGKYKSGETKFFEDCNLLLQMWANVHFYKRDNMIDIMFSASHDIDTYDNRMIRKYAISEVFFGLDFRVPRANKILHEWNYVLTIDVRPGPSECIPEYQVWVREYRGDINPSPEGEQGFEDVRMTIWISHFRLGTTVVTPEMWDPMANIM